MLFQRRVYRGNISAGKAFSSRRLFWVLRDNSPRCAIYRLGSKDISLRQTASIGVYYAVNEAQCVGSECSREGKNRNEKFHQKPETVTLLWCDRQRDLKYET
jgi:hypothetical protein